MVGVGSLVYRAQQDYLTGLEAKMTNLETSANSIESSITSLATSISTLSSTVSSLSTSSSSSTTYVTNICTQVRLGCIILPKVFKKYFPPNFPIHMDLRTSPSEKISIFFEI